MRTDRLGKKMSSTADMIRGMASGQIPAETQSDSAQSPGETELTSEETGVQVVTGDGDDPYAVTAGENEDFTDSLLGQDSEKPEQKGSSKDNLESGKKELAGKKETITYTDSQGKKRQVEVDLSDASKVKKAYEMMYGARKWQAERDQARKEVDTLRKEREELAKVKETFSALEKAWQEGGEEGVLDLLAGEQGASRKFVQRQLERQRFLDNASPEQLAAFKAQEESQKYQRELDKIRKEQESFQQKVTQERELAEVESAKGTVYPVFDKYSFTDRLGSESDEQMFNEILWNTSMKRIQEYEEKGIPVTKEIVDKEFRTVSQTLRKRMSSQAEKKASQIVEQKKKESSSSIQQTVKNAYSGSSSAKEASSMIAQNDIKGIFKNWNKLKNSFGGN
jgi:hypothetical protein